MALRGDTVWPFVVFKNRDGVAAAPDSVTFALYDDQERVIISPVDLDSSYSYATGSYEYPLVVPKPPSTKNSLVWEFVGMVDGHPEVLRGVIQVTFIP